MAVKALSSKPVNIRLDEEIRPQFERFCHDIGINMSTAFNIFARQAVREQRIPFEIRADTDPFWSEENQAVLAEAVAQLEAGKGAFHEVIE